MSHDDERSRWTMTEWRMRLDAERRAFENQMERANALDTEVGSLRLTVARGCAKERELEAERDALRAEVAALKAELDHAKALLMHWLVPERKLEMDALRAEVARVTADRDALLAALEEMAADGSSYADRACARLALENRAGQVTTGKGE